MCSRKKPKSSRTRGLRVMGRTVRHAAALALFAAAPLWLVGCASSPDPDALEWHAVDPERDAIPYDISAARANGVNPAAGSPKEVASAAPSAVVETSPADAAPLVLAAPPPLDPAPAPAEAPARVTPPPADGPIEIPQALVDSVESRATAKVGPVAPEPVVAASAPAPEPEAPVASESEPGRRPGASVSVVEDVSPEDGGSAPPEREPLPLPEMTPLPLAEEEVELLVPDPINAGSVEAVESDAAEAVPPPAREPVSPPPSAPEIIEAAPEPQVAVVAPAAPDATSEAAPSDDPVWNDSVVARVNGAPILMSELKEFALDQDVPLTSLTSEGLHGDGYRRAMTARVDQTLLVQAAGMEDLQADELDVARRVDAFIAQRVDEAGGRAAFLQALRDSQLSLESFRNLLIERETRRQLASGIVQQRVTISSSELEAFTRKRTEAGEPLEEVQLAQILVACPAAEQGTPLGDEQYRRALELAGRAGRQTAAFSRILSEINADPSGRERGGVLGWIDPASLQPAIREAVARLRPGQVSEPVTSDAGYHVLLMIDRRSARDMLFAQKFEVERTRLLEELRAKAQIEIYPIETAG